MEKKATMTIEEWDRIIELLNFSGHPDSPYLCSKLYNQLDDSSSDEKIVIPSPTSLQIKAVADIIQNKQILQKGMTAYDQSTK